MNWRRNLFCYLMVAPALIIVGILGIYPMLDTLRISFLQYDLLRVMSEGTPFVGFANYREIFQDERFLLSTMNTITFVVVVVGILIILGLLIAEMLNRDFLGRGAVRTAVLVPWFIPPVVASMVWTWMFQTDRSPINHVFRSLGLIERNIPFLTDITTYGPINLPLLAVSSVRIWHGIPFVVIFLLAGLQTLPKDLYEAAEIDGANAIQKFFNITIPLLKPVLSILLTLLVIGGLGHFEINYIMTRGGPRDLTNILSVLAYQQAFSFQRFDLAAASSMIVLLLTGPVAYIYIRDQLKD